MKTTTKTNNHVYIVEEKCWNYGGYEIKSNYFNLGWNVASQRELEENGASHTRNDYYDENSGVTFRVLAHSQKEAIKRVRKYVKEKNYPVFHGLDFETDYVSLRLR